MNKQKHLDSQSLLQSFSRGVEKLCNNVGATLGPRGQNVLIHQLNKEPIITKDGVTVAKAFYLEDPFENAASEVIKQASLRTNIVAGDGTTTAAIIARDIFLKAQKNITNGSSPIEMKRGIEKATRQTLNELQKLSQPISSLEDIKNVAFISSNNDESIAELIALAIDKAGKDGSIAIEEARSLETSLDLVEGFRFDSGFVSNSFITDERKGVLRYDSPLILVTNEKLEAVDQLLPILEKVSRDKRPLIIVCEDIEGQALAALIMNTARGSMKVAAIKAPRYGEERKSIMEDLCISTGATFISRARGMDIRETKLQDLGMAKKIEASKTFTIIMGGKGESDLVDNRIENLKNLLQETDSIYECERIQERITRLASGIAVIKVGAATEIEMIEKKHRVEDALEAVKSALMGGILPGGGASLVFIANKLEVDTENEDQAIGVSIFKEALYGPFKQIAKNCDISYEVLLDKLKEKPFGAGYDFRNKKFVNLLESGIIDPCKVTKAALMNGVSAATTLLTTSHAIVEVL